MPTSRGKRGRIKTDLHGLAVRCTTLMKSHVSRRGIAMATVRLRVSKPILNLVQWDAPDECCYFDLELVHEVLEQQPVRGNDRVKQTLPRGVDARVDELDVPGVLDIIREFLCVDTPFADGAGCLSLLGLRHDRRCNWVMFRPPRAAPGGVPCTRQAAQGCRRRSLGRVPRLRHRLRIAIRMRSEDTADRGTH